jgi:hypothetical protein
MSLEILIPKPMTPQRRLQANEAPGRKVGRLAGGHISDLAALKHCLTLCPECRKKFNHVRNDYVLWRREWFVVAHCDGCRELNPRCLAFIHESTVPDVGEVHRRRGRWAR